MTLMPNLILAGLLGYLAGSISFAILIPRLFGTTKDIRQLGSGNAGSTNVLRTQGKKLGALVLALDLLKGAGTAWAGLLLFGPAGGAIAAAGAILGHCYPLYFGFKGGKAVATGCGSILVLCPKAFLCLVAIFLLTVSCSGYVSLGSILAASTVSLWLWLFGAPPPVIWYGFFGSLLILYRHRPNIQKLLKGTENRMFRKPKKTNNQAGQ